MSSQSKVNDECTRRRVKVVCSREPSGGGAYSEPNEGHVYSEHSLRGKATARQLIPLVVKQS